MPAPLSLTLTAQGQQQLQSDRDRHPLPYVRDHEHVATLVCRYCADGLAAFLIKAGRRRKLAFSHYA